MKTWSFPSVRRDGLILIVGLGETGLAAARWCLHHGARLRVTDSRPQPGGLDALRALPRAGKIDLRLGTDAFHPDVLDGVHTLVLSPGLAPHEPVVAALLDAAQRQGVVVIGEIELFALALRDLATQGYAPTMLAITGTNGKTTVTAMTRRLLEASGRSVRAAGNIGPAALAALHEALDAGELPDVWVMELSSFQLHLTRSLALDAAAVLNVSPDHLDWHGSFEAYREAKAGLLRQARLAVINRDDPYVCGMVEDMAAQALRTFGAGVPKLDGDLGLELSQEMVWLVAADADSDEYAMPAQRVGRRSATPQEQPRQPGRIRRLMPADALRVRGQHNALNAQVALLLGQVAGGDRAAMLHALRDYAGEPHRLEFVRSVAGVTFINDSKGTNVGATAAALQGLEGRIVLIAGGLAKDQDFTDLARIIALRKSPVVLLGRDAPVLARALGAAEVEPILAADMDAAIAAAYRLARPGDTVLLSPACASMDMFQSYVQRGQCFVQGVEALALDLGEVA